MSIDLDKLEQLAEAATPGPWRFLNRPDNQFVTYRKPGAARGDLYAICALPGVTAKTKDFKYIAALSPDVTLAMIAELRKLRDFAWRGGTKGSPPRAIPPPPPRPRHAGEGEA